MTEPTIVSFWAIRPDRGPNIADYPALLRILQRSCDALGLRHVVLTDHATVASGRWPEGIEPWASDLPASLMRACCEAQARYLETAPDTDTLFVGADCIMRGLPSRFYPTEPGLCVTFRGLEHRYPINLGAVMVRRHSLTRATRIFRRVANRCATYWCADQQAIIDELAPMPRACCTVERRGVLTAFLPMSPFNVLPETVDVIEEPFDDVCMLHFRGKLPRKEQMVKWAARHMPEGAG